MKCFPCQYEVDIPALKGHYLNYHLIDPNEENFVNLFKPNYLEDFKCEKCQIQFSNEYGKKRHMFLRHYKQRPYIRQIGGSRNVLPWNTLKRGPITNYSINFNQH